MIVTDIFKKLVEQTAAIYGSNIFFFHGHIREIANELIERSKTAEYRSQKYPSIMLLHDFPEIREAAQPWDVEANLQILIVAVSDNTFDAATRLEKVYKPTLYPIYQAFVQALKKCPDILSIPVTNILHEKIDRLSMSNAFNEAALSQGIQPLFADHLDGIEIRNLNLKLIKNC